MLELEIEVKFNTRSDASIGGKQDARLHFSRGSMDFRESDHSAISNPITAFDRWVAT